MRIYIKIHNDRFVIKIDIKLHAVLDQSITRSLTKHPLASDPIVAVVRNFTHDLDLGKHSKNTRCALSNYRNGVGGSHAF